jgi:endonuclease-3
VNNLGKIIDILKEEYPYARCELDYGTPFQLLTAVILSAQCTDRRVNAVTGELFKKYKTAADFTELESEELEKTIYTCGFYKNKAANIIACAKEIADKWGGEVPSDIESLTALPGIGRKSANVILSEAFKIQAFAVDTHVMRVCVRLGIADKKDPVKIEKIVTELLDNNRLSEAHKLLVFFGRYRCHARKPECEGCRVRVYCKYVVNHIVTS